MSSSLFFYKRINNHFVQFHSNIIQYLFVILKSMTMRINKTIFLEIFEFEFYYKNF